MHPIDWTIIGAYLLWMIWDGLRRTKDTDRLEGYFLGARSIPWWAAGLSVMATQLSAITMIGTTGQAYADGMRFIQFYYALPIAMIVLSVTLVPFFHRAKVYTAYEYLERRFDAKTRALTSLLFLLSRSMSLGVVISAPAVVLAVVLDLSVTATALLIAMPTAIYTMFGGVQAVTWTDVKQMFLIVGGLLAAVVVLVLGLPDDVGVVQALKIAGSTGRMQTFDFSFDLTNQYTFWSGTIAALFLFCSYFGTDQSQVQRYLTTPSVDEARSSLLMSAYWKIPLQALVLLVGVLMFLFYVFTPSPMLFNPAHQDEMRGGARAAEYAALERRFEEVTASRTAAAVGMARAERGRSADHSHRGAGAGPDDDRRRRLQRRQLRVSDFHHDAHADRNRRSADRGDFRRGDVDDFGGAGVVVHRHHHRFLSPLLPPRRVRRPLPARLPRGNRVLGTVRERRRRLGGGARLADRGRQPLRLVLLRLHSRRVHPGHRRSPRHGDRRLRRLDRGDDGGWRRRQLHRCGVPVAQRHRSGGRGRHRPGGQPHDGGWRNPPMMMGKIILVVVLILFAAWLIGGLLRGRRR
jgi:SSS family transporter